MVLLIHTEGWTTQFAYEYDDDDKQRIKSNPSNDIITNEVILLQKNLVVMNWWGQTAQRKQMWLSESHWIHQTTKKNVHFI